MYTTLGLVACEWFSFSNYYFNFVGLARLLFISKRFRLTLKRSFYTNVLSRYSFTDQLIKILYSKPGLKNLSNIGVLECWSNG